MVYRIVESDNDCYGISATDSEDEMFIADITEQREKAEYLVCILNKYQIPLVHFHDIVIDFIST